MVCEIWQLSGESENVPSVVSIGVNGEGFREVRRRTRAARAFTDGKSTLMLAAARLRHVAASKWANGSTWT